MRLPHRLRRFAMTIYPTPFKRRRYEQFKAFTSIIVNLELSDKNKARYKIQVRQGKRGFLDGRFTQGKRARENASLTQYCAVYSLFFTRLVLWNNYSFTAHVRL